MLIIILAYLTMLSVNSLSSSRLCAPSRFCPQIKQTSDGERKQLTQLRDTLKSSLQAEQKEVNDSMLA